VNPVRVRFEDGTLVVDGLPLDALPDGFQHDPRIGLPRGPACAYHPLVTLLHRQKLPYDDVARKYAALRRPHASARAPRPYQAQAIAAWRRSGRRGTVVLPTGAGKSFVAELAIADADRSALIVAPTLALVGQWYDGLKRAFGGAIGVVGGGAFDVQDLTVTTYDSAWMHMARFGDRFGLIVFDEVHHLPAASFARAAEHAIAPFRLGLTATLERDDGAHERLDSLVGPVVHRMEITELAGEFLADYTTEHLTVWLSEEERASWDEHRARFRAFVDGNGLSLGGANGWTNFLRVAGRSEEGREALRSWRQARRILQGTEAKMRMLDELLRTHADGRCLVFTSDNATAYEVSRRLLVPVITHHTDVRERSELLAAFSEGRIRTIVASRVLNEGVDLPSADVAIVLSGTATVREHVQRLGRILRKHGDKQATLYEIVCAETDEEHASRRRRDHVAYRHGDGAGG
jgi:superfamily II DNA or RNA helicase